MGDRAARPTPMSAETRPTIIIGAPRSGTNMLRDILASHPECATWPCDEINPIWRAGVERSPHDELEPSDASRTTERTVRRAFRRQARRGDAPVLVEKTCANSLRVPFVESLLEEPCYVYIVRDGRDAVPSAIKRWQSPFELRYTLQKARFVPKARIPLYAWRIVRNRFARGDHVRTWGPRFDGIDQYLQEHGLAKTVAKQWATCVERADQGLGQIPARRVHSLRYEDFVQDPEPELAKILESLGLETDAEWLTAATADVSQRSIGKGWSRLPPDDQENVHPIIQPVREQHGYA